MEQIEIVTLKPDDWQTYRALRLEALQTDPQAFGSTYADNLAHPESWWRGRLSDTDENSWLLFAKHRGSVAGMIGSFMPDATSANIIAMYVNPAFRGQGIARALMAAALDKLRQNPALSVARLEVNEVQTAALRLYESFGFQIISTENGLAGDGQTYAISNMELRLD
jgi:ribosomal protein S18 acetylase RimI-like enzyme